MAVFDWQAFEFEPIRIAITTCTELHRQLTVHAAGCSILCSIHSADETQPGRNSCPEFAIFGFQFGLYHVIVTLSFSFLRSVSLAVIDCENTLAPNIRTTSFELTASTFGFHFASDVCPLSVLSHTKQTVSSINLPMSVRFLLKTVL